MTLDKLSHRESDPIVPPGGYILILFYSVKSFVALSIIYVLSVLSGMLLLCFNICKGGTESQMCISFCVTAKSLCSTLFNIPDCE